jgi:hypothetical protein
MLNQLKSLKQTQKKQLKIKTLPTIYQLQAAATILSKLPEM